MTTELYFFWSSISLTIFYLFYLLLLRRETFFVLNRVYLLTAICLSIVIPLLDLSSLVALPKMELIASTLTVIGGDKLAIDAHKELDWVVLIYWAGVILTASLLWVKLLAVKRKIKLPEKGSAFSFWQTKVIDEALGNFKTIEAHENVHVKQFHTLDVLLIEVMGIFFWFNPLVYFYRRSLKFIHEYLADDHAANLAESKKQYAMVLFLQNFKAGPAIANTFSSPSLLEARIRMLQRKKSKAYRLWKYTLCMPLIALLLLMCSFHSSGFGNGITNVDQAAGFPGGFEAFSSYVVKTARKVSNKNGRVKLSFIVETNGEITNEEVENSLDKPSDKEALRVIKLSPRWMPALQNGKKVRSAYQIGINFIADNQLDKY